MADTVEVITVNEDNGENTHRTVSIATPFILGFITVVTAWSGFQATKWGETMSNSYATASAI